MNHCVEAVQTAITETAPHGASSPMRTGVSRDRQAHADRVGTRPRSTSRLPSTAKSRAGQTLKQSVGLSDAGKPRKGQKEGRLPQSRRAAFSQIAMNGGACVFAGGIQSRCAGDLSTPSGFGDERAWLSLEIIYLQLASPRRKPRGVRRECMERRSTCGSTAKSSQSAPDAAAIPFRQIAELMLVYRVKNQYVAGHIERLDTNSSMC